MRAILLLLLMFISVTNAVFVTYEKKKKKRPWSFRVELSYVNTSGNVETQTLSSKSEFKWEGKRNRFYTKGSALYAKQEERETGNKLETEGRWEILLTKRFFTFILGGYERDKFSGYKYRWNGGPGIGYDLIRTKSHELKVLLSLIYYYNKLEEGEVDNYATYRAETTYRWKILKNLIFKQNLNYIVETDKSEVYFVNSETSLEVNVIRNVALGVSYKVAYQNVPPEEGIERLDTELSTSLIVKF